MKANKANIWAYTEADRLNELRRSQPVAIVRKGGVLVSKGRLHANAKPFVPYHDQKPRIPRTLMKERIKRR